MYHYLFMSSLDLFSIKDKVAVVLGGTSGIGQAIARGFAEAGAITIASSRDQAKVNAMADEIEKLGSKTLRLASDVQDRASLETLCQEVVLAFGQVDILVVTSGTLKKAPTAELSDEDWNRVIDINLNGTFRANQIFGRQMIKQKSGCIINTCSLTSFVSLLEVAPYCGQQSRRPAAHREPGQRMGQAQHPRERHRAGLFPHAAQFARARPARTEGGHLRQNPDGPGGKGGRAGGRGDLPRVAGVFVRYRRDHRGGRRIPGPGNLRRAGRSLADARSLIAAYRNCQMSAGGRS